MYHWGVKGDDDDDDDNNIFEERRHGATNPYAIQQNTSGIFSQKQALKKTKFFHALWNLKFRLVGFKNTLPLFMIKTAVVF